MKDTNEMYWDVPMNEREELMLELALLVIAGSFVVGFAAGAIYAWTRRNEEW